MRSNITRRTVLKDAAAIGLGVAIVAALPSGVASAAPAPADDGPAKRLSSANGWGIEDQANHVSTVWTRPVSGTGLEVDVRIGDVEDVLVHVIRRFHYEVSTIFKGELIGWRPLSAVRKRSSESNQASGTAVRIRPGHYPTGARGGFFPYEQVVIRDILAELKGVVRWGGDGRKPDESLFYIAVKPGDPLLAKVAGDIRAWKDTAGAGAGAGIDVFSTPRRKAARRLELRQRPA